MANETLLASQAALRHTEVIAAAAIADIAEDFVVSQFMHEDSMDGDTAPLKRYPVRADLGTSSGGTEGTPITANTEVTLGTSVTVTPAEGVLDAFTWSEQLIMQKMPGQSAEATIQGFLSGDEGTMNRLLGEDLTYVAQRGMRKIEADARALIPTLTNSVGTIATTPAFTLDVYLAGVYRLRSLHPLRPNSDWVWILNNKQLEELDNDMLVTGGGRGAALFSSREQAQYTAGRPLSEPMRGYWKHVLDYPVCGLQQNDRILAETDAADDTLVGALVCRGSGAPGSRPGWAVRVERHGLKWRYDANIRLRAIELVQNAIYSQALMAQRNAIKVLTASGE